MSILCTLYLKDGVILASESRATHSKEINGQNIITGRTDDLHKTLVVSPHNVGISYCSNAKFNGILLEDYLSDQFSKTIDKTDTVTTIAEKILNTFQNNDTQFIVSGYISGTPYVYKVKNDISLLNRDGNDVIYGMEVRGLYQKTCDFFEKNIQKNIVFGDLSLEEGVSLAKDLIEYAIKNEDGCGGEISVLIIKENSAEWYK